MIPLRALNDTYTYEENSDNNESDSYEITGEAEETIVISEYVRALRLKDAKRYKAALKLFLELLRTDVLNKELNDSKNNQILLVKYNCFRNVGFICKESGQNEMALYYLIKATEIDSSDIYTMYYLGQLSHSLGREQMATICYEKCIEYNPNHWPSKQGILKILCTTKNVIDAYFWARHCLEQDDSFAKAIEVLVQIRSQFPTCLKFLKNIFGAVLDGHHGHFEVLNRHLFFSGPELHNQCGEDALISNIFQIKERNFDWITLGNLIINLQDDMLVSYKVRKTIDNHASANAAECVSKDDASAQNEFQSMCNMETEISGSQEDSDAKYKRRDTELKILEQWGWHKSKKSLRKKNSHDPSDPNDFTADGFIKRTLSHHFLICYESDTSPFSGKKYDDGYKKSHNRSPISMAEFLDASKKSLIALINDFKKLNDSYSIAVRYTYCLSNFWNEILPEELCTMYRHLYQKFNLNENNHSWFELSNADVNLQIQTAMFYLELEYDFLSATGCLKSASSEKCRKILHSLHLYMSLIADTLDTYVLLQSRYLWLNYIFAINEGDLHTSVTVLQHLQQLISEQNEAFAVNLPNVRFNNYFDLAFVDVQIEALELRINMQNIESFYQTGKYEEVVHILTKCFNQTPESQIHYKQQLDTHVQMEILLESLWRLEHFQDCISMAEKVLKYSTDNFFMQSRGSLNRIEIAKSVNSSLLYIHEIIEKQGCGILEFEYISRMVQSIHKILTNLLDVQLDKNVSNGYIIDCWRAWIILHYVLEWENDRSIINRKSFKNEESYEITELEEEKWFSSTMIFFVAHELLGRRQWCSKGNHKFLFMILNITVPKLRSPLFEPYRDIIQECLEQTTFCLYGYPQKKARMRHIQDHETKPIELSWPKAAQLLDIYRPHVLPQFNSYRNDSISAEMETLLQHCLSTMPNNYNVIVQTNSIEDFINGKTKIFSMKFNNNLLSFKISWIYYLLADYYFKCRDFSKAIQYYKMDLTVDPTRFDSWAGISLSKASKCETMIGSQDGLRPNELLKNANDTLKCFDMCVKINENDPQLWVENGSFAYSIQSYCSRFLKSKLASPTELSFVKLQQTNYTKIVIKSFNTAINHSLDKKLCSDANISDRDDEQWLYHYMLGKIFEKDRGDPVIYLTHYFKSSLCLYESNATYPIKVSHSNPSHLCIESLELFYRTNAAILKYVERNSHIRHSTGLMFVKILKELAVCPFAVNRAKINEVLLKKHKLSEEQNTHSPETSYCKSIGEKMQIMSLDILNETATTNSINTNSSTSNTSTSTSSDTDTIQEMSSESDSDCTNLEKEFIDSMLRDTIVKECLKNLEECVTRFPEHYKSLYRLAYHYMYSPGITKSLEKCYELLLGSYKTTLGAQVQGLFTERRSNNFFNGIWRIPSSDIDRPGSFETHLCKCTTLLITVLTIKQDHETILELAIHLYRIPEADKKYLYETDREMLFQIAVSSCVNILKNKLKEISTQKDDSKLLSFMIDTFKLYRKSIRHMHEKEHIFSNLLIEAYLIYINEKIPLPANANQLDLALKLCTYEMNYRKTKERMENDLEQVEATTTTCHLQPISSSFVPGLTKLKKITMSPSPNNEAVSAIRNYVPPLQNDLLSACGKIQFDMKEKNLSQIYYNFAKENSDLSRIFADLYDI